VTDIGSGVAGKLVVPVGIAGFVTLIRCRVARQLLLSWDSRIVLAASAQAIR
jgi:hypothetical protein